MSVRHEAIQEPLTCHECGSVPNRAGVTGGVDAWLAEWSCDCGASGITALGPSQAFVLAWRDASLPWLSWHPEWLRMQAISRGFSRAWSAAARAARG